MYSDDDVCHCVGGCSDFAGCGVGGERREDC